MIINNHKSNSASDAFKYYTNLFMIFYAQLIMQLRKGDKPTQTRVFLAIGAFALILVMALNLFHVIDITAK